MPLDFGDVNQNSKTEFPGIFLRFIERTLSVCQYIEFQWSASVPNWWWTTSAKISSSSRVYLGFKSVAGDTCKYRWSGSAAFCSRCLIRRRTRPDHLKVISKSSCCFQNQRRLCLLSSCFWYSFSVFSFLDAAMFLGLCMWRKLMCRRRR